MIISTGMAGIEEIQDAIDAARGAGCREIAILHCVSGYPAPAAEYNLRTIPDMMRRFGVVSGLSDHTMDNTTAIGSVVLGASLIEKHFTLDRSGGGPDDSFSLEPAGLAELCSSVHNIWAAMGSVNYQPTPSERENLKFRRSLYFIRDLATGDVITKDDVKSVRPGSGLAPKLLSSILGRRVKKSVSANTAVTQDLIA
jgi:N-acetylneuraminate synthase